MDFIGFCETCELQRHFINGVCPICGSHQYAYDRQHEHILESIKNCGIEFNPKLLICKSCSRFKLCKKYQSEVRG